MIALALKRFFRLTYRSLFKTEGTHARLTRKRVASLVKYYTSQIPIQFIHLFCLVLDEVLFPGYRQVEIKDPVFILGNPRGGTTHLLRLMARDEQNFYCPRPWEAIFAPSILQKKLIKALARRDQRKGGQMQKKTVEKIESASRDIDRFHQLRLKVPDEDEFFFLPIFSSIQHIFPFPFMDEFDIVFEFDAKASPADKKRLMAYYRRIMQRTLYGQGPTKRYLSKAPSNNSRVDALMETFPDAKFVYIARNPLETLGSQASFLAYQWHEHCDPLEEYPFRDFILKHSGDFYRYPLERLEQAGDPDSYAIVNYDDLVRDPEQTIADVYQQLGWDISPEYAQALRKAVEEARRYKSKHEYSLEQMGFTREQIIAEYQDVFERFGFDTGGDEG